MRWEPYKSCQHNQLIRTSSTACGGPPSPKGKAFQTRPSSPRPGMGAASSAPHHRLRGSPPPQGADMQIGHLNGHHPLHTSIKRTLHTSDKATVIPAPKDGRRTTRSQGWERVALFSLVTFFVNTKKVTPPAYLSGK